MANDMFEKPRWGLHIDIEGFGVKYDQTMDGVLALNALMDGIYKIGVNYYREPPDRIFSHQFGDGFIIVSDFHEDCLDRAISIAICLLRHVLAHKGVAKAAIAEGGFSDIQGFYPQPIRNEITDRGVCVSIGAGLMTVFPVMGTALINAVRIDKLSPSGSLLTLHKSNTRRINREFQIDEIENDLISVNWLKDEPELVSQICAGAGLSNPNQSDREKLILNYIQDNKLKEDWVKNTLKLQGIAV